MLSNYPTPGGGFHVPRGFRETPGTLPGCPCITMDFTRMLPTRIPRLGGPRQFQPFPPIKPFVINCNGRPGSHAEWNLIRFESSEIVLVGFSRPRGLGPRLEDFDRSNFI